MVNCKKSCLFFTKQNKTAAPLLTEYRETSARRKHINFDRGVRILLFFLESQQHVKYKQKLSKQTLDFKIIWSFYEYRYMFDN